MAFTSPGIVRGPVYEGGSFGLRMAFGLEQQVHERLGRHLLIPALA